jgi:hypothetical protein
MLPAASLGVGLLQRRCHDGRTFPKTRIEPQFTRGRQAAVTPRSTRFRNKLHSRKETFSGKMATDDVLLTPSVAAVRPVHVGQSEPRLPSKSLVFHNFNRLRVTVKRNTLKYHDSLSVTFGTEVTTRPS